ncbi:hypothetical protein [Clostridium sp. ZBS2]|uniref:hypothetical protein n=1 Tax=Clostridium sp. ZBS2 TaxID=2949976 RepID=UPI0020795AFA|nr:hypothetical protein [Clostridium sp. ZBS2]
MKNLKNVEHDLSGYVLIAENILDIEVPKQDILKNIIAEYIDLIEYFSVKRKPSDMLVVIPLKVMNILKQCFYHKLCITSKLILIIQKI